MNTFNADENDETMRGERMYPFPGGAPFESPTMVSRRTAKVSPSLEYFPVSSSSKKVIQ